MCMHLNKYLDVLDSEEAEMDFWGKFKMHFNAFYAFYLNCEAPVEATVTQE